MPPSAAAAAKLLQSCPILCDPIDGSPPSSPVPGILQARTLEWVAMSFSNAWKWEVKVKLLSCVWLPPLLWYSLLYWTQGSVQSLSRVWLFLSPWTAARQASLSITNSQSLFKPMSIELLMLSNHLILCHPLLLLPSMFPGIRSFPVIHFFASGGQSIGVSASASALPMNIQDWFPLGWTGWTSLQSKGLSRVFSNTTVQKHQFFGAQPSL